MTDPPSPVNSVAEVELVRLRDDVALAIAETFLRQPKNGLPWEQRTEELTDAALDIVLPIIAHLATEIERLTAAMIYAAETTNDKHTSRKLFAALSTPSGGRNDRG